MKKTLKVIASTAIAMSAFASVAMADDAASTTSTSTDTSATTAPATKTSADFTDLANVDAGLKAKIDALLKAGVFEGTSATTFGINENMTRAQFAKVLDLIYGVNVDMTVKTSSFSDVTADDQANGWAIPYIEAAKKAGLIDGVTDTTFTPGDNVTLGQFATALVKGLGVKPDMTGTPWYADAVKQAITKNVLPADTDGSKVATRADLVVGAYGGQQAYATMNQPAQVSVVSAKATGVQTVTVTFDRDVDTSKATLALTKGTIAVNTTTKFSDDKKSATLTLTDTKLSAGDYTVTLGGLDASAIKTATGTFTAQDETVQKMEFVTTSDNVSVSKYASVLLKATNQYGENASFSAGNYTVQLGNSDVLNAKIDKTDDGLLKVSFDTKSNYNAGTKTLQSSISVVPVTVWFNDTRVSATKNFTLGTTAFITKMDLGDVKYSNGGTSIGQSGETATFTLNAYDQYGNLLGFKAIQEVLDVTDTDLATNNKVQVIFSPYEENLKYHVEDYDSNDTAKVRVNLANNIDKSGDYTAQVYLQGASATTKISVTSAKVATKVQIGDLSDVIASGDQDVYIPIVAFDANGNQLSTDDLTSDTNVDRIKISVSGATALNSDGTSGSTATIWNSGDHKGSIRLSNVTAATKGVVTVTAYIATANANSTATKTYTVNNVRIPDHLKIVNTPATKIVKGASSKFTFQVIDQYGKSMDNAYAVDSSGALVTASTPTDATVDYNTTATRYIVNVTKSSTIDGTNIKLARDNNSASLIPATFDTAGTVTVGSSTYAVQNTAFGTFNDDYDIYTGSSAIAGTSLSFTVDLVKVVGTGTPTTLDSKTINSSIVDTSSDTLTYALNTVPTLWNAIDSGVISDAVYGTGSSDTLSGDQQKNKLYNTTGVASKFAREVTVNAKNAAGDTVAIPKAITAITSSNTNVVQTAVYGSKAFAIGDKAGTATIAVTFTTADGSSKTLTQDVTVKSDALTVAAVSWDDSSKSRSVGSNVFSGVNVTDNYGVTYEDSDAQEYNYALGVTFSVTNIKGGSVSIDQYGNITSGTSGTKFDLTVTSATGKSATQAVTLN